MSLRLKHATRASLERFAKQDDRPVSYLARLAIEEYVARREQMASA